LLIYKSLFGLIATVDDIVCSSDLDLFYHDTSYYIRFLLSFYTILNVFSRSFDLF